MNSTFIQQEILNGTRNLKQQDIQTPSHFVGEGIVETIATTTQLPLHLNLTTLRPKNLTIPQITLQSTVKPCVVPRYTQIDYQTFKLMAKQT